MQKARAIEVMPAAQYDALVSEVGCILFRGFINPGGYGMKKYDGVMRLAHRIAYCEHHGIHLSEIKGMVVRHNCDIRGCINPYHLSIGTQKDNVQDMISRGRSRNPNCEGNPNVVLTRDNVDFIRSVYKARSKEFGATALGKMFGVAQTTISAITTNKTWINQGEIKC